MKQLKTHGKQFRQLSPKALHLARTKAARARKERKAEQRQILAEYAWDPQGFIQDFLGWVPYASGDPDNPGQVEILGQYQRIIRAQVEAQRVALGKMPLDECVAYDPDQPLLKGIHLQKGHNTGGTKLAAGIVNHFLHSFAPSIVYTYAPGWKQIKNLLWKEILSDRSGAGLPGKTLSGSLRVQISPEHFASGIATKNLSKEDVQGQHQRFLLFIFDEAEGIQPFVYEAVRTMLSGGIVLVIYLANPRTRTSTYHQQRSRPDVLPMRMSCLHHPNVKQGQPLIPDAVQRQYVADMIRDHCTPVEAHSAEQYTFTLPWKVTYHRKGGTQHTHPPGTIFQPDGDFMYQVLGIPPATGAEDVLVHVGRFEAAVSRADPPLVLDRTWGQIGCDVARFGNDKGSFFSRYTGRLRRFAVVDDAVTQQYVEHILTEAQRLRDQGCQRLSIRVDGTGGFGSGVVDMLRAHDELNRKWFAEVRIHEVHFGSDPYDRKAYRNIITECYAETNETLLGLSIEDPPPDLEMDLCDRKYVWRNYRGQDVKALEDKKKFRKRHDRSPDDGDACALCCAPEFVFRGRTASAASGRTAQR